MAQEIIAKGIVDLNRWTPVAGGLFVFVEPTDNPRRFYIKLSSERPKVTGRVRHRKHKQVDR